MTGTSLLLIQTNIKRKELYKFYFYLYNNQLDKAEDVLNHIIPDTENDTELLLGKALLLSRKNEHIAAMRLCEKVENVYCRFSAAILVEVLVRMGKLEEAKYVLTQFQEQSINERFSEDLLFGYMEQKQKEIESFQKNTAKENNNFQVSPINWGIPIFDEHKIELIIPCLSEKYIFE